MQNAEFITHNLNPEQKQAVETLQGPLLVLAGAGSGKTRVLTHRVANVILKGLAQPEEILAVTFTNKAAAEMEHRIYQLLSQLQFIVRESLWVNTFHSFCARLLRQHIQLLDYQSYFNIYDSGDQLSMIKKVLQQLNMDDKIFPPKQFQSRINAAKMLALTPKEIANSNKMHFDKNSLRVYECYEENMKKSNSLDFGDLLLKTYELFRMYPDILEHYQNKFKYILIDEYQDTNHIQYLLIKMLASKHRNLCVVGDEDQSIYSWRGADITNILNFEKDFPEAQIIKLEENYRSTKTIVSAATALIKNNGSRKDKTLFTENEAGELIVIKEEASEYDEARFVIHKIDELTRSADSQWSDIAIFYRTNGQSRVLEEQLRMKSIPYRIVGGMKFYERMEIKDILSYMRAIINNKDDISLRRIINTPTRGIGKTTIERLEELANTNQVSLWETIDKAVLQREFNAGVTSKLRGFAQIIENIQLEYQRLSLSELYNLILKSTQYSQKLELENTPEADARLENIKELANAISHFEEERGKESTLQNFLEEMALVSEADSLKEHQNSVTLMTLHISKGLEFPYVFIVGMEDGLFPSAQSIDETDTSSVEEERRLAYVGLTRARKRLFLTYAQLRRIWGQEHHQRPSRFLKELPTQFIQWHQGSSRPQFLNRWNSNKSEDDIQIFPDDFPSNSNNGLQKGHKVRHPTFGVGSVFSLEGDGDNLKVSVLFSDKSIKKFVAKYARLERV
jgi:DNA helicase-2/ATP-dependent DNA helicase PcrA